MPQVKESAANFLDAVAHALNVSWLPGSVESADLQWRSCALTVDAACRFHAGATAEIWEQVGFDALMEAVEKAAAARFGSQVRCAAVERCGRPPVGGVETRLAMASGAFIEFVISAGLAEALGGEAVPVKKAAGFEPEAPRSAVDMLMHVEIPVSVSLGRTRMRMKDLLVLSQGSVVELDQELGDAVEIRVNNCVIARGEVVAVDGNYGVRVLEMISNGFATRGPA